MLHDAIECTCASITPVLRKPKRSLSFRPPQGFANPLRLLRLSKTTSASLNRQCQMQASVPFSVARFSLLYPRSCLPLFLVGSL